MNLTNVTKQRRAILSVYIYDHGEIARRDFACSYLIEQQSKINIVENSETSIAILNVDDFQSIDISSIENNHRLIDDSTIRQFRRSIVTLMKFRLIDELTKSTQHREFFFEVSQRLSSHIRHSIWLSVK